MGIEQTIADTVHAFPGARIIYLGLVPWQQLKEALNEPRLRWVVVAGVRVQHDPGLPAGHLDVVRVPDAWGKPDERKPRKRPRPEAEGKEERVLRGEGLCD